MGVRRGMQEEAGQNNMFFDFLKKKSIFLDLF